VYAVRLDDSLMEDETRSRLREIAHKQELYPHLPIQNASFKVHRNRIIKAIGPERIVGNGRVTCLDSRGPVGQGKAKPLRRDRLALFLC
jgi:hypothetical protein